MRRKYDLVIIGAVGMEGRVLLDLLFDEEESNIRSVAIVCNSSYRVNHIQDIARHAQCNISIYNKNEIIDRNLRKKLIKKSKILVNFWKHQKVLSIESLIKCCINNGTHYVDALSDSETVSSIESNLSEFAYSKGVTILPGINFNMFMTDLMSMWLFKRAVNDERLIFSIEVFSEYFDINGRTRLMPVNSEKPEPKSQVAIRAMDSVGPALVPKKASNTIRASHFNSKSLFIKQRASLSESTVYRSLSTQTLTPVSFAFHFASYMGVEECWMYRKHLIRNSLTSYNIMTGCLIPGIVMSKKIFVAKSYRSKTGRPCIDEITNLNYLDRKYNCVDIVSVTGPEPTYIGTGQILKLTLESLLENIITKNPKPGLVTPSTLTQDQNWIFDYLANRNILIELGPPTKGTQRWMRGSKTDKHMVQSCCQGLI